MSVRAASMPATCLRCPCLRSACGIAVDAAGAGVLPAGRENSGGIPHGFPPEFLRIGQPPPPGSELRGEVEADVLEILLRQRQPVARVGEEDVAAVLVDGHVGVLAALEIGQLRGVVALDPAGFVDRDRLPAAGGVVFVFESVLDDFELERPDRADDLAAVERGYEQLRHAFVHQLVDALGELLEFQRVSVLDVAELLGGERRDAREFELLALGEGVADLEVARIVQADDVARVGEVDDRFLFGHEGRRRGELELLAAAYVQVVMVALERPGADFQEGDAVAVVGVHVGVDLEDEARHLLLGRLHAPRLGLRGARRGGDVDETFEQLAHAEIVDRRAEEDRRQIARQIGVAVEGIVDALDQFRILAQLAGIALAHMRVELRCSQIADFDGRRRSRLPLVGGEERQTVRIDVVNALERRAVGDRKGQRTYFDAQLALHLVQQVEGVLARAVQLVDEDHHRRLAHPAHLHQAARLLLDALGAVDDDDDRIDGRQRAVGVLGEILVAGRIENIDLHSVILETHDGGGHRDAALPFDLHEIGRRALLDLVALDGARHVDRAAEEQQLLGKGGFAGVGVRNDGERPPPGDLFL